MPARLMPTSALGFLAALTLTAPSPAGDQPDRPLVKGVGGKDKEKGEPARPGGLTQLEPRGWATLTGTVTYDGDPPEPKKINFAGNPHAPKCHEGATEREVIQQTWLVNPKNKGVSDVVIYLKAPRGKFLKLHESYLAKKGGSVALRQPHCAFIPHVSVYWAAYRDKDGRLKPTGQKLQVFNDAKFDHNVKWEGRPSVQGKGGNVTLSPGGKTEYVFRPDLQVPITFSCGIHPWMNATCWALDTPYAARTDEDGKFTIENVPAGVEVHVVAWHEDTANDGFFHGGREGRKLTLKPGTPHILNLKVKAR
jgi:hypothetical protein